MPRCELAGIIYRVLGDSRYYPLGGEKEVVPYIEGVTTDADQGADNFLRSSYLPIGLKFLGAVEYQLLFSIFRGVFSRVSWLYCF